MGELRKYTMAEIQEALNHTNVREDDIVRALGISTNASTEEKQEAELARSYKTNAEDLLISLWLYQTGVSMNTEELRDYAAQYKGRYSELRDLVFVGFPEAYNPLWLKILNAMGIANIVNVAFE